MILTEKDLVSLRIKLDCYVNKTDTCWLWTKGIGSHGYGEVYLGRGNQFLVHRVALALKENLDLNGDWLACHINECSNRHCINPEHLYKGTYISNLQDVMKRKEHHFFNRKSPTHCKRGHELTKENKRKVNRGYACRQCDWLRNNHKL